MPTQLYRAMRLPLARQCAGGAKAYRMRPEKAQLCRGLTWRLPARGYEQTTKVRCFTRVRVHREVRTHSRSSKIPKSDRVSPPMGTVGAGRERKWPAA